MARPQILEFFERESGEAYDPKVVSAFTKNLEEIEDAARSVKVEDGDVWGIKEVGTVAQPKGRNLEKVQPTLTYGRALSGAPDVQRELCSVFEFARAEIRSLSAKDIFTFIGLKLANLIDFDGVVFYTANPSEASLAATHVVGTEVEGLFGLMLGLEQKLTGWAAANNQSLCNLPPFPDFLKCEEPRPSFQLSAIAPMNRDGTVLGAISLYRKGDQKFREEEFRRLEIIAAQTSIVFSRCLADPDKSPMLIDPLTNLANEFQLYLMFDQIGVDAHRYEYPLALFSIHLDNYKNLQRRWGYMSGNEAFRTAANYLRKELRESDLLVRYGADEFVSLNPRVNRELAEALKSRLQNELDHFHFGVRPDIDISLPVSIGIAVFPEDGLKLETLISVAQWRLREDRELRVAVRHKVKHINSSS